MKTFHDYTVRISFPGASQTNSTSFYGSHTACLFPLCFEYYLTELDLVPSSSLSLGENVLVSWGCCDKVPQMGVGVGVGAAGGLQTMHTYSFAVLGAASTKSRCQQGPSPSEGAREDPSLPLPACGVGQQPWAFLGLQTDSSNLCPHCPVAFPTFPQHFSVPVSVFPSYKDTSLWT